MMSLCSVSYLTAVSMIHFALFKVHVVSPLLLDICEGHILFDVVKFPYFHTVWCLSNMGFSTFRYVFVNSRFRQGRLVKSSLHNTECCSVAVNFILKRSQFRILFPEGGYPDQIFLLMLQDYTP